jgi:hypothetical protein
MDIEVQQVNMVIMWADVVLVALGVGIVVMMHQKHQVYVQNDHLKYVCHVLRE